MPYIEQFGLGISATRPPRSDTVPAFFNAKALMQWQTATTMARVKLGNTSPHNLWKATTRLFVKLCVSEGINPYTAKSGNTNLRVHNLLRQERTRVIRFLTKAQILRNCKIRRQQCSIKIRNGGFTITIDAKIDFNRDIDALVSKYFRYRRKSKLYKSLLSKNTVISVSNEVAGMNSRWHLVYVISCPELPIDKNKPMLSRKELLDLIKKEWEEVSLYIRMSNA